LSLHDALPIFPTFGAVNISFGSTEALNTGADLLDGHDYSAVELIIGQNRLAPWVRRRPACLINGTHEHEQAGRLRTQGSGFGLRSKPLPIFHRSDERFDHFSADEVAVELV